MAYMFFSTTTSDVWRYDFPGRQGGEVPLPDGEYRALCLNDDSAATLLSDPAFGYYSMTATTPPSTLYRSLGGPDSLADEKVRACPTQLWGQAIESVSLTDDGVNWRIGENDSLHFCGKKILTVFPRPMMATYSYEILDVSNLEGARTICAALSGMASTLYPALGRRTGPEVALPFGASKIDSTTIGGRFLSIGLPDKRRKPNTLWLYVWLTDGRKFNYAFDVTDQTRNARDPMNVHIKIRGLDLPASKPATEGGFDISVDGWIVDIIDINS